MSLDALSQEEEEEQRWRHMHNASQPNTEETTKAEQSVPFKSIAVPVFASRTVLGLVLSGKQSALHLSVPSECFSPDLMCDLFVK